MVGGGGAYLFLLGAVGLLGYLFGYYLPRLVIHPPRRRETLTPADLGFEYRDLRLRTSDGLALSAYYAPAPGPAHRNLILLHGNGSCKELYLEYLPQLLPGGTNLLLLDQRAHGRSQGEYHTFGYREWRDVAAALGFLAGENALPTGVFGHSMGGAVALSALSRLPLTFGVVESCFADFHEITHLFAQRRFGLPLPRAFTDLVLRAAGWLADFTPREVRPERTAAGVTVPVLVIHGTADEQIDVVNGRRLYRALGSTDRAFYPVAGAGHDDVCGAGGADYWRRLRRFLTQQPPS